MHVESTAKGKIGGLTTGVAATCAVSDAAFSEVISDFPQICNSQSGYDSTKTSHNWSGIRVGSLLADEFSLKNTFKFLREIASADRFLVP